jgi:urease accessory protein
MLVATLALHAAGIALGLLTRDAARWLPRAVGAAVALFGASLILAP